MAYGDKTNYQDMSFGDVINILAPFEENTPEYYNGHNPLSVRGEYVTDSRGRRGKWRPVMVVDVTETELIYTPLTTSVGSLHDEYYQYHVKDNSMTPQNPKRPNLQTFAEIGSVRKIPIKPHHTAHKYGTLADDDIENIKAALDRDGLSVSDGLDKYKYVSAEKKELLANRLEATNYQKTEYGNRVTYSQDNREFTVYDSGVIHFHFELPLETVRRRTEIKENRTFQVRDTFAEEISKIDTQLGDAITYE